MDTETESLLIKKGLLFSRDRNGKIVSKIIDNDNGIYICKDFVFNPSDWWGFSNTPVLMTKQNKNL